MFKGKKVIVVMPAYNAALTLRQTHSEVMQQDYVDEIILVDDASQDDTVAIARTLDKVKLHVHASNRGYGANQKTCYKSALEEKGDIIVMVHPDYQYTPGLIPAMVTLIGNNLYPCVIGSRILGGGALTGGMPLWKYIPNRFITLVENLLMGAKLSEYHSGFRAFSRELLEKLPLENNSDDFIFDNQMLAQILWLNQTIAEISCPTRYFKEASSINFSRSLKYGFGCLLTAATFRLAKMGLVKSSIFPQTAIPAVMANKQ
ncbi:MAG: glycosyltransferase family 2 protein [bacterium]|jgi:glycosyltransferase involved in cell wall biosynthesis|nr:glycosyltransferase family 2 protein [bacterium]MDD4558728.1 glycosyltransferase family 2 protein [bacterium]